MTVLGGTAAVMASLAFSATSTLFTLAGRKFKPSLVMMGSLPLGLLCLILLHWAILGKPFPQQVEPVRWLWLGTSSVVGFGLASIAIVNAFVRIGPRLALLIAALGPILGALLAWIFLGEVLAVEAVVGITLTIGGIAWVLSDGARTQSDIAPEVFRAGMVFAFLGAILQAVSFILSKLGLEGDFEPLSASLMRLIVGTVALWGVALIRGVAREDLQMLRSHPLALRYVVIGAITGPVIGASFMLVAVQNAPVGIAQTLGNLMPIFLIPIGYMVFKERITRRAVIGTAIAVLGTTLLFLL